MTDIYQTTNDYLREQIAQRDREIERLREQLKNANEAASAFERERNAAQEALYGALQSADELRKIALDNQYSISYSGATT